MNSSHLAWCVTLFFVVMSIFFYRMFICLLECSNDDDGNDSNGVEAKKR